MQLSDFDYHLPEHLIASQPLVNRDSSRLLVVGSSLVESQFKDIVSYITPDDLLVLNDTKVIKARLFGHKLSGGKVEVMLERIIDETSIIAHIRTSKGIKVGMKIVLPQLELSVSRRIDGGLFQVSADSPIDWLEYFEQFGNLPLPPYMQRQAELSDENRYQTVFAKYEGSVAAPTAGLHFTDLLLKQIKEQGTDVAYVTLHVGSGTFKPVSMENIAEHKMHSEIYNITQDTIDKIIATKKKGGKIISVGTTSLRTLETVANRGFMAGSGETDIFITPGYQFKVVDKLITNFHLPKSTLLMLVMAFAGRSEISAAYQYAINNNFRFFSYGDAMFLTCKDNQ